MKTLIIGLLFLSFVSVATAQNAHYLKKVSTENKSEQVKQLQDIAASYDITKLDIFESKGNTMYDVTFKNPIGKIVATYTKEGIIVKSIEEYRNVKTPYKVTSAILKNYSGWITLNNVLKINYSKSSITQKIIKVKISKNEKEKIVSFNLNDNKEKHLLTKN